MVKGIVLDVNETLFSLDALQPVFDRLGLGDQRDLWFARTLRSGFAVTCLGGYRPFPEAARAALVSLAPDRVREQDCDALLACFAQLDPHPDVELGLRMLAEQDVPVVSLSVGNADNVARLFDRAGLGELVGTHLSCTEVQRWKPAPEPYLHACSTLGVAPDDAWMVAAHSWDIGGAAAVGLRTAWISRLEGEFDPMFGKPDVSGPDLPSAVRAVLDNGGSES